MTLSPLDSMQTRKKALKLTKRNNTLMNIVKQGLTEYNAQYEHVQL